MNIDPVDVRNHTFQKRMRGVDEAEVRAYLDLLADRLEGCVFENEDLRGKIDRLEREVEEFRRLEKTLRDALVSAERLADERIGMADKEARIILKNAEVDAEKLVLRSREEVGRLQADLDDLRRQRISYVERFRALLRSQAKILEASLGEAEPESGDEPSRRPDSVEAYLGEQGLFSAARPARPAASPPPSSPAPPSPPAPPASYPPPSAPSSSFSPPAPAPAVHVPAPEYAPSPAPFPSGDSGGGDERAP